MYRLINMLRTVWKIVYDNAFDSFFEHTMHLILGMKQWSLFQSVILG